MGQAEKGRPLCIRNPVARRLADELSRRRGVSLTEAVIGALQEKLAKTPRPIDRAKLEAIRAEARALPVLDNRSMEEILSYDEYGIPR